MPKASRISNKEIIPPYQIKRRDKAMWIAAEEAAIIVTLLLQKAMGISSESGFKPAVWPLVVDAVGEATSEGVRKNLMQCKTCYHKVCVQFSLYLHVSTDCLQLKAEYKIVRTLRRLSGFG